MVKVEVRGCWKGLVLVEEEDALLLGRVAALGRGPEGGEG